MPAANPARAKGMRLYGQGRIPLTGSATRKPRLVGGDKGRNKKTDSFLAGKPRPVSGELQKENRDRLVVIKDMHDEP